MAFHVTRLSSLSPLPWGLPRWICPGEKCCGSRKEPHPPGSSPEGQRAAAGGSVGSRVLGLGGSAPLSLSGTAAQDRGVSSPASLLQVSALNALLPPGRGERHGAAARWSTRTGSGGAAAAPWPSPGRSGLGSGAERSHTGSLRRLLRPLQCVPRNKL